METPSLLEGNFLGGILTIIPIVDQVKESFLQKSLQVAIDSYNPESIKETLNTEIDSTNAYKCLAVEGVCMLASNETTEVMTVKRHLNHSEYRLKRSSSR